MMALARKTTVLKKNTKQQLKIPMAQESKAGGLVVQAQPGQLNRIFLKIKNKKAAMAGAQYEDSEFNFY